MGNIGFKNLRNLGLTLRDTFNIKTFVETGTYKAQTTTWASDNFNQVFTIEAYEPLYLEAVKNHGNRQNITFLLGDSGTQLKNVLAQTKEQSIIWLDAHWCGGVSKDDLGTSNECPIKEELQAIKQNNYNHIVLIDDARLFVENPPYPHDINQWPRLHEIQSLLPEGYKTLIWQDVIICVHSSIMPKVKQILGLSTDLHIAVLTSNEYLNCLQPFAYLFNKFWNGQPKVTVVRYEIRPPKLPANFSNFAIGNQNDYTWSSGLIKYLNYLSEDFLILLLEDYFIDKPVKTEKIKSAYRMMQENENIVKFDLTEDRLKFPHIAIGNGLIKSNQDAPFLTSTQAAIWRKDFLLSCLHPSENAWQFEKKGTRRLSGFDKLILGFQDVPLSYINAVGGEGNKAGRFDFKKIPKWMIDELNERKLL